MDDKRLELQGILEGILGSRNVYFMPPPNVQIRYPAIVYSRLAMETDKADDIKYFKKQPYKVILIDYVPDSPFVNDILDLPYCSHQTPYITDGLYHDPFTLYY